MEQLNQEIKKDSKGFAIASLSCGIIGMLLFIAPYIAIMLSIMAIVFANLQNKYCKNGMATAGLVLGILGIIWNLFWLFIVFVILVFGGIM